MIGVKVRQGRDRPLPIERLPLVRQRQIQNAARSQDAEHVLERTDWVLAMFQKMISDDEILTAIGETAQPLAVIYHFDFDKPRAPQLGIMLAQLVDIHTID